MILYTAEEILDVVGRSQPFSTIGAISSRDQAAFANAVRYAATGSVVYLHGPGNEGRRCEAIGGLANGTRIYRILYPD